MISFARENYPIEKSPNLSWRVMDARELDFDTEFDIVFSNAVMHWIFDHLRVLERIKTALRPGGHILMQMGGRGNVMDMGIILSNMIASDSWRSYFVDFTFPYAFYGPDEYRPWLEQAGLQTIRVELVDKDMVFEDGKALAGWIRTTWMPFTERVPEDLRETFIDEIVARYLESHPPGEDGFLHLAATRLEVEARKTM
ncbi:MAG: hypothetical protein A2V52_05395 [Actinobacteria bacterium RBG_19FT_COMBO_54_7]|nr:MAG: hypothetical protein A2V52_05395 [Actinobacteria bacterium RBG_19FT_COMBO_54_7]